MTALDLSRRPAPETAPPQAADPVAAPVTETAAKPSLVGLTRARLGEALMEAGVPERQVRMRSAQLNHWLHNRGATSFDAMTNVSKDLRAALGERFTLDRPEIVTEQISKDGTRKWLLRLPAQGPRQRPADVEVVYIPEEGRGTLCVSSQVGCTLTCTFCHTGTQVLVRNLTAAEIVSQLIVARDRLGDWNAAAPEGAVVPTDGGRFVTNIVFMGMGEPLYNLDAVRDAIEVMADGEGLGIGRRKITVSTSGVVPEMKRLGEETGAQLAISLHAVRDELRDVIVPINRKYDIKALLEACRTYPGASNARRITFEYVMLKGVNDSPAEARELVRLLAGLPAKINLIPFNPWPGSPYECSDWETIEAFSEIVFRAGYASPVRTPRGRDISAACGQLKSESKRLRAKEREALEAAE
ncbi:MAG: 23S rRNA (adenine(2503)-C(2))-methyltransferase RlmN [Ancylobacter novellus]|uniref:Dual-specificity RNA methyltransferase RlmN n=1 Tax=Ancylobacter novellus TaxID=921 RepID=A0A2W5K8B4_ANCNO|nr:MAG: 23S rRNA (adenine(2503)-C(2))-methyltransferase RlmN [Ancylobacter novellus]